MHIAILETGRPPGDTGNAHGTYPDMMVAMLEATGRPFVFSRYAVIDDVFPSGPAAADGFLITGSRHGAYEQLPWMLRLETFIRDVVDEGRPLVGICFGHQIIAKALGGRVEKYAGGWGLGRTAYEVKTTPAFVQGMAGAELDAVHINAVHQDQVVALPPDATVIAGNDHCRNAMLQIGARTFTIQPHPEFTSAFLADLMAARPDMAPAEVRATAQAGLEAPLDSGTVARWIAAFFHSGVTDAPT